MKAYVIKNEEGKYLTESLDWNDCIFFAALYDEPCDILYALETWQEITITEGDLEKENEVLRKALKLACEKLPMEYEYCSNHPDKYNLQDEYDSDEPYWVEEGGCEFDSPENCLDCVIDYFIQQAKEQIDGRL